MIRVYRAIIGIGIICLLAAGLIFVGQCLAWFNTATWTAVPLSNGLTFLGGGPSTAGTTGPNNVVRWLLGTPLALWLLLLGLGIAYAGMHLEKKSAGTKA